jgi:NAD(P)-dependent dehydrogenase (short-subunit alcohol dehydrogenase family)
MLTGVFLMRRQDTYLMGRQVQCHHIRMSVDLTGRVVLVTGGTKGLGRGLTQAFEAAGASVMICARNAPEVPQENFVAADLRDAAAAVGVIEATVDRFGRLDVVINNAGGTPPAPAAEASPRLIEKVVALNLLAPFYVAQAAYGVMHAQPDGGTIINIGSLSGTRPSPGTAAYGAAKAGLANLTQSLAMEWAPKVRVNLVTVGYLETEQAGLHFGDADAIAAIARGIPMQRLVRPEDVAQACLFLASTAAEFITGADIAVHGGGELPPFLTAASHD